MDSLRHGRMAMRGNDKPVDRQVLYDEVWAEPVSIVARWYGVSDVGMVKINRTSERGGS